MVEGGKRAFLRALRGGKSLSFFVSLGGGQEAAFFCIVCMNFALFFIVKFSLFVENADFLKNKKSFAETLAYSCVLVYNIFKSGAWWGEVFQNGLI